MNEIHFKEALKQIGISLDGFQFLNFKKYMIMLQEKNKVMNLTSIDDEEGIYEKHFYDSLLVVPHLIRETKLEIADIGSGAGFPGIPLAIVLKDYHFTLIEPTKKRALFLEDVIRELDLTNVTVIAERSEDLLPSYCEYFDVVTSRAVAKLQILLELSFPLLKVGGFLLALKGKNAQEEIEESKHALYELHGEVNLVDKLFLPTNNEERNNLIIYKKCKTLDKYPRNYSQIKKNPL